MTEHSVKSSQRTSLTITETTSCRTRTFPPVRPTPSHSGTKHLTTKLTRNQLTVRRVGYRFN